MSDQKNEEHVDRPNAPPGNTNNKIGPAPGAFSTIMNQEEENMEVHHHTHHTHERRNWKSYFWEFLMLFLAVTLGFFVENQREHYIEHHRAREFSKSLVQDFQNDIKAVQEKRKSANTSIASADSLLQLSRTRLEGRAAAHFSIYTRFT
jgi:hypothetical protein